MKKKNLTLPTLEADECQEEERQLAIICGIVSDTMSTNYVSRNYHVEVVLQFPSFLFISIFQEKIEINKKERHGCSCYE